MIKMTFILIGLIFFNVGRAQNTTSPSSTTAEQWIEDIDFLVDRLETTHPKPFNWTNALLFSERVTQLKTSLNQLSYGQISLELMKLVAMLGDGHTHLQPAPGQEASRWFPVRFYQFEDGLFITAIDKRYKRFAGAEVIKIAGQDPQSVHQKTNELYPAENHFGATEQVFYLSNAFVLHHLGIIDDVDFLPLRLKLPNGHMETVRLESVHSSLDFYMDWRFWGEVFGPEFTEEDGVEYSTAFDEKPPSDFLNEHAVLQKSDLGLPLHLRSRIAWWGDYLVDSQTLYLQFNSVQDRKNQTFADFYTRFFKEADRLTIDKFVLDLRYNSGGNGALGVPFINEIIKREGLYRPGKFFVVTGRKTFSAAVSHVLSELVLHHLQPVIIGEPSAARWNMFGDPVTYYLPHSNLKLNVSSRYYQGSYWGDKTDVISVDVPIRFSSVDYFSKRDPVMEFINGLDRFETVLHTAQQKGADAAQSQYLALKKRFGKHSWWRPFKEAEMNRLGYGLLSKGAIEDALILFKLNTQEYPQSANTWDSLGEAYSKIPDKENTIACYEKALQIDPDYPNSGFARALLEANR